MAHDLGVPGYSGDEGIYNYIVLTFWGCGNVIHDTVKMWTNLNQYMPGFFNSTNKAARQELKRKYNQAGVKIMLSAFGGTIHPTSEGKNAKVCANELADFVLANDVDGVDLDY